MLLAFRTAWLYFAVRPKCAVTTRTTTAKAPNKLIIVII